MNCGDEIAPKAEFPVLALHKLSWQQAATQDSYQSSHDVALETVGRNFRGFVQSQLQPHLQLKQLYRMLVAHISMTY